MAKYLILQYLSEHQNVKNNELAESLKVSCSLITMIISSLADDKYVSRETSKENRRFVSLNITDLGINKLSEYQTKLNELDEQYIEDFEMFKSKEDCLEYIEKNPESLKIGYLKRIPMVKESNLKTYLLNKVG